ncbi:hypothetical protein DQW77_15510 [Roseovarius sp. TE539]|nr:hypothetical protein DQW77_15510 [Roseovarius sp. TE539]
MLLDSGGDAPANCAEPRLRTEYLQGAKAVVPQAGMAPFFADQHRAIGSSGVPSSGAPGMPRGEPGGMPRLVLRNSGHSIEPARGGTVAEF